MRRVWKTILARRYGSSGRMRRRGGGNVDTNVDAARLEARHNALPVVVFNDSHDHSTPAAHLHDLILRISVRDCDLRTAGAIPSKSTFRIGVARCGADAWRAILRGRGACGPAGYFLFRLGRRRRLED